MKPWVYDIIALTGMIVLVTGVSLHSIPLGVITCGVVVLMAGILGAQSWVSSRRS